MSRLDQMKKRNQGFQFAGPVPEKAKLNNAPVSAGKRVGGVRKRGESKEQFDQRMNGGQQDNSDIDAIFRGVQNTRGIVRRGLSGAILNPDGSDPGNSFDRFMRQNPHLGGAAERQAQYDAQARAEAAGRLQSAVNERKALQEMQQQQSNVVTGADGYRTIFDGKGGVIGTTAPVKSKAFWSQDNAINRGTASGSEQRDFANSLQQAGMNSVTSRAKKPKGLDAVFPGQSSPPGGQRADRVGSAPRQGEPGGEIKSKLPEFTGGMPMSYPQMGPNQGPQPDWNKSMGWDQPNAGPQQPNWNQFLGYGPNVGPQQVMGPNEGPQLQFGKPGQIDALRQIQGFVGTPNRTAPAPIAAFNLGMSNVFPGVKDWEYLQTMFPGLISPQAGSMQNTKSLLDLLNDPAYRSQINR